MTLETAGPEEEEVNCPHIDLVEEVTPSSPDSCLECRALGDEWVHLRLCMTCGNVGCCDDSKNTHATKHFHGTRHPIVKSYEPDEDWMWCYVDELVFEFE